MILPRHANRKICARARTGLRPSTKLARWMKNSAKHITPGIIWMMGWNHVRPTVVMKLAKKNTADAANVQMMRTNPTTLFPEICAHPTPPARHRKSKRKLQAPLKTASADSKHAAAPEARLPPDQPASEKPTITAPAAKSTIGSAATTTSAAHGRPAKAASTNPCRPRHREIASVPPKCANVRTGILQLETRARTTTLMLSALHAQRKVATFSKAATTPASPGPRHARVDSTKPERRAAPKTASAQLTSASATTARALRGLHA